MRVVSKTFAIEDCYKANLSASYNFGTSDQKYNIFEIPQWDSYEIEGNLKGNSTNRFSFGLKLDNNNSTNAFARIGVYTTKEAVVFDRGGNTLLVERKGSYTPNTDIKMKFAYDNGNIKFYIDDEYYRDANIDYYPIYLMLHSYASSKTVSVSNVKIKPL